MTEKVGVWEQRQGERDWGRVSCVNCVSSQDEAGDPDRGPDDTGLCSHGEGSAFCPDDNGRPAEGSMPGRDIICLQIYPTAEKDI